MADEQAKPSMSTPKPAETEELRRDADFVSRYANNFQIESTAFDLKMTFGIVDQRASIKGGKLAVEQHTSMSLSWPEVKLLIYFLQLHLNGFEKDNGKIKIPINALPPEIPDTPPDPFNTPQGRAAFDLMRRMRADFIANLKD